MKSKFILGIILVIMAGGIIGCSYDLNVENRTSQTLDIYVDSQYEGTVAGGNSLSVRNLYHGEHLLEALDRHDDVVADDIIHLDRDMTWAIYIHYR